jgi:mannose-1-phosphate guanylyltransferase/mannose-6-phosphate isomerase
MFTDVLILAGGQGERLWPASTEDLPKQFMKLFDEKSFLQTTILRALALKIRGNIIIVTRKKWLDTVIDNVLEIAHSPKHASLKQALYEKIRIIGESAGKNTAPAAALVCRYLLQQETGSAADANILVLPSDHIIKDETSFAADMECAASYALENNIMVFGIKPCHAETGFGYIQAGASRAGNVFQVSAFREKPGAETAAAYVASGRYYWNSGLYGFRARFFLEELALHAPAVYQAFTDAACNICFENRRGLFVSRGGPSTDAAYGETPSISIDYAVSEKSARALVVRASFDWDDAGTWDALAKYAPGFPAAFSKNLVEIQAANNFVYSDIPVSICGIDGLVVVIKNGSALVMKKGAGNWVKEIPKG